MAPFFILRAPKDAPPNNAAVIPKVVGKIAGLIALAIPIKGAVLNPSPTTPTPYSSFLNKEFLDVKYSTFYLFFKNPVCV